MGITYLKEIDTSVHTQMCGFYVTSQVENLPLVVSIQQAHRKFGIEVHLLWTGLLPHNKAHSSNLNLSAWFVTTVDR